MKKFIITIIAGVIIASVVVFALLNKSQKQVQFKMGTFVEITINGPIWLDFDKIFDKAFLAIDEVQNLADRYSENSQLSIVNRAAFKYPVKVNEELYDLIEESINISRNTKGAFDITVTPLVELWGFYKNENRFPANDRIEEALKTVGFDNIVLDSKNKSIFFKKYGVGLDLSAIAKGYAVDKAARIIRQHGVKSAIINAGGDIYCLGKKNIFQEWKVGIKDPADNKRIIDVIYIKDKAVATSGGYEKFFVYKEKKYSHLIDPRTGLPLEDSCNATVIAKTCALADALATALCILGKDKIEQVEAKYDIEVFVK